PHLREVGLDGGVAFRVRDHGGHAERANPGNDLAERERPIPIRRLDQEVLRVAREPEPAQLVARKAVELLERYFAAWQELELDALALERRAQLPDTPLHRVGRRRKVLTNVRGRGNGDDPVGNGCARDLERVFEIARPIVEAGEDVRVQIDHVIRARISARGTVCLRYRSTLAR